MSYTEIFIFDKNGDAEQLAEINNAFRGGMAIWGEIEKKYLPPLPKPSWMPSEDYEKNGYNRINTMNSDLIKEIWNLFGKEEVSFNDKLVLGTTFDKVIVKKEDIPLIIEAFELFEGETSLKEQACVLKTVLDKDIMGIGWNQTSVNRDSWGYYNYDEDSEKYIPYNMKEQEDHWFLLDELNEIKND